MGKIITGYFVKHAIKACESPQLTEKIIVKRMLYCG